MNRDKILREKLKELKSLFLSPLTDKYPDYDIIESRLFKHRIEPDNINKHDLLRIQGIEYRVVNQPKWKEYGGNERDGYKRVELVRASDNNYYTVTINRTENYKRRLKYEFENLKEAGLYFHDVTVKMPNDDRKLTRQSHYDEEGLKILYSHYDPFVAYTRQNFMDYIEKNASFKSLVPDIEQEFSRQFKNKEISEDISLRKWCDEYLKKVYDIIVL